MKFTAEDFDQVLAGGNTITVVTYLPNPGTPGYLEGTTKSVRGFVVRLIGGGFRQVGADPIVEASKLGTILLIVRLGPPGLESPVSITTPVSGPKLDLIPPRTVNEGSTLTFQARVTNETSGEVLTFALEKGVPAGASIDPKTGFVTFTPGVVPGSYSLAVRVTDSSTPPLSDIRTYSVTVQPAPTAADAARAAFVTTLYAEMLNRAPEPAGLQFWTGALAGKVKPARISAAIWHSPEHRVLQRAHLAPPIGFARAHADALAAWRRAAPRRRK